MTIVLSDDNVRRLRLRAQGLDAWHTALRAALNPTTTLDAVTAVTSALCGIQAQYMASAALAVRARSPGLVTAADVERALVEDGTVVRTWLMRGTLHLVAADNYRSWLPLLGPHMLANDERRRTQLSLDDAICERALPVIDEALSARPLARSELAAVLAPHGIPTAGQAMPHLLYYAAYRGVVCCGPDRAGGPTYIAPVRSSHPFKNRVTLNHLTLRYLAAYGPARPEDFSAWAGVPLGLARASWHTIALAGACIEGKIAGEPLWMKTSHMSWLDGLEVTSDRASVVNLIPAYDPYLLGYQNRDLVVAPEYARRVHPGGGVFHNVLLVDGWAQGTWRTARRRDHLEVVIEPFAPLAPDVYPGIEAEVADLGRFYAARAELVVCSPT